MADCRMALPLQAVERALHQLRRLQKGILTLTKDEEALGLKWVPVGSTRPKTGNEIPTGKGAAGEHAPAVST